MKEQRFSSHSPGAVRERLRPKTAMLFARKGAIVWTHEKVGRGRRNETFLDRKSEESLSSRRNKNVSARMQEKQKTIRQSTQRLPLRKGSCHGEAVTERFERNNMDNLSVICFANATVSLRLGHDAGLTAHRAVIQHRAAASLPCTGEASRCGGDFSPSLREAQTAPSW